MENHSDDEGESPDLVAVTTALASLAAILAEARQREQAAYQGVEALIAPLCEPGALACLRALVAETSRDHRAVAQALQCLSQLVRAGTWPVIDGDFCQDLARLLVIGGKDLAEAVADILDALLPHRARVAELGDLRALQRAVLAWQKREKSNRSKIAMTSKALETLPLCEQCGATSAQALLICGGCRAVSYCSRECQKSAWPGHKASCNKGKKK